MVKGIVMLRFSAPRTPNSVYETWVNASRELAKSFSDELRGMGHTGSFRLAADIFGNVPVNILELEFESAESAAKYLISDSYRNLALKTKSLGAHDWNATAYSVQEEA